MGSLNTGGGSSAVAASAHAGCERFRHTDPLVIGMSRRALAKKIGHPDSSAGIPEARWMRAMTFERLVRDDRFVSQLLTTAVGALGLGRPKQVRRSDGGVRVDVTAKALQVAHDHAVKNNEATTITGLAVPFVGLEHLLDATPVKPDFALVTRRTDEAGRTVGSWLIMGDAKDYERVRSRIDDQRMLKGFLQVALGAESVAHWSKLPDGMLVHRSGALAVPRNAFLQPEAIVEQLDDHRREVRGRVDERTKLMAGLGTTPIPDASLAKFVAHRTATYDPASCVSCAMFEYCRSELRASSDPEDLLVELGIRPEMRPAVIGLVDGTGNVGRVPDSVAAGIRATVSGLPEFTGQLRIDPAGLPGTINLVVAKSDSAALGIHGIGLRRIPAKGRSGWTTRVFDEPQSPSTRLLVMGELGAAIRGAMSDMRTAARHEAPEPIHLVVPDIVTADVIVSIADSLAGVETSRLRWQRDLDQGREALTFDGEQATVPAPLTEDQRLAVSFLLEQDRARAMGLRQTIVDLRGSLALHLVPGGPSFDHGRLDYLVDWAEAGRPLDHRAVSDDIAGREHTPGARLSNERSDVLHNTNPRTSRAKGSKKADPRRYRQMVEQELAYKASYVDRTITILEGIEDSSLRPVYRALEADSQRIWRRRLDLHAFDLVRFGRTSRIWRNDHVDILDADGACAKKLTALGNPQAARDLAVDAGTREVALAEVVSTGPLELDIQSRRLGVGERVAVLQINGRPCVEADETTRTIQKGSFKFGQMCAGPLVDCGDQDRVGFQPRLDPGLRVGDELVIADLEWLGGLKSNTDVKIDRPKLDTNSAPKDQCSADAYRRDPEAHRWCCRPHEAAEAEWADILAGRRARGELNPQTWPPIIDEDQFDTPAAGAPTADDTSTDVGMPPTDLTIDDID